MTVTDADHERVVRLWVRIWKRQLDRVTRGSLLRTPAGCGSSSTNRMNTSRESSTTRSKTFTISSLTRPGRGAPATNDTLCGLAKMPGGAMKIEFASPV